jgi:hypothetical protein
MIIVYNNNNNNKMDKKHWYEHVPKSVETNQKDKVTILWNQQVQTDRTIPNNKPDIIKRDNEKRTCMLIDVAIPGDRNVSKKEAEKILKYKDLTTEIQRMWNVKTNVIPVIIIIQKIPEQRTGNPRTQGATENSHIGHCTHTAESADVKVQ